MRAKRILDYVLRINDVENQGIFTTGDENTSIDVLNFFGITTAWDSNYRFTRNTSYFYYYDDLLTDNSGNEIQPDVVLATEDSYIHLYKIS